MTSVGIGRAPLSKGTGTTLRNREDSLRRSARSRAVADLPIGTRGGCGVIASRLSNSAHLHRPWRANQINDSHHKLTDETAVLAYSANDFVTAERRAVRPSKDHHGGDGRALRHSQTQLELLRRSPAGPLKARKRRRPAASLWLAETPSARGRCRRRADRISRPARRAELPSRQCGFSPRLAPFRRRVLRSAAPARAIRRTPGRVLPA